jgi:ABC-2 type transport system ATP-binding protein
MANSSTFPTLAVRLDNVSVRYSMPINRVATFKEYIIRTIQGQMHYQDFWALNNICLEISKGETLGVIGKNGAGKSTLLKVISRVLVPTKGRLQVQGVVSPLLNLGAGFHPELTGIENIYLNAALLGHSRQEIRNKMDEILEFAQIGKFIDAPLRTYSSGMVARLGFSVATSWVPSILILDEILAVGDEEFREKCYIRLTSFQNTETTIILVTHDMTLIEKFCKRAAWLHNGELRYIGDVSAALEAYRSTN